MGRKTVQLRELTDNVFSMMECKKALFQADGDRCAAADWLVQGHWRAAKLISWDNASLTRSLSSKPNAASRCAARP